MACRGKFIVIEGPDGGGKSTAQTIVEKIFQEEKVDYRITREPGGTPYAEKIREILLSSNIHEPMLDDASILLLNASRVFDYQHVIKPWLEKGYNIICSRFDWSTYAYAEEFNKARCIALHELFFNGVRPDLIIYLEAENNILLGRIKARGGADRIEQTLESRLNTIKGNYRELMKFKETPFIEIDTGNTSIEDMKQRLRLEFIKRGIIHESERVTADQT